MQLSKKFLKYFKEACSGQIPPEQDFKIIERVLKQAGFTFYPNKSGSHRVAYCDELKHPDYYEGQVTFSPHGSKNKPMIKKYQVKNGCRAIRWLIDNAKLPDSCYDDVEAKEEGSDEEPELDNNSD